MIKITNHSEMTNEEHSNYQKQVEKLVKNYLDNSTDVKRVPCADLLLELTGVNAHLASDQVYEMRVGIMNLQAFLMDPSVNRKFFERFSDGLTQNIGLHLSRLVGMLTLMDNKYAYAEIALAEMEIGLIDVKYLNQLEEEFSEATELLEKKAA